MSDNIILSNGKGAVCCRWDGNGNLFTHLNAATDVPSPSEDGGVTFGLDPTRQFLVAKVKNGATVYETRQSMSCLSDCIQNGYQRWH